MLPLTPSDSYHFLRGVAGISRVDSNDVFRRGFQNVSHYYRKQS